MIHLVARPPFSLRSVVRSHGWVQLAPFERQADDSEFRYRLGLADGRVTVLHVRENSEGVSVESDTTLSLSDEHSVRVAVSWMLGLDDDYSAFYASIQGEPRLSQVVAQAQGRVLRSPTLFEDTVKTLLTVNTSWSGTKRMNQALVDLFGMGAPGAQAFPTPARLAEASEDVLRKEAKLGFRARWVHQFANAVAAGEFDIEALRDGTLPTIELRKQLLSLMGIGNYAAANLLVLLRRYDFIPIDSYALKLVSDQWHGGERIGPAEVEAAFARWGDWKGLVYFLWDTSASESSSAAGPE